MPCAATLVTLPLKEQLVAKKEQRDDDDDDDDDDGLMVMGFLPSLLCKQGCATCQVTTHILISNIHI